jgi:anti-sigma B factor antagonist
MASKTVELLTVESLGNVCMVTILARELDTAASEELTSRLLALLNQTKATRYVLDFEQVRYMDSSCFGALVTFLKWLSRFDGKIALANVSENVRFLFSVTKLDKVFPIHGTVDSAIKAVER